MEKNVGIIGLDFLSVCQYPWRNGSRYLHKHGWLNTGNNVFLHAVDMHINTVKGSFKLNSDPDELRDKYDVLVFPVANMIQNRTIHIADAVGNLIEKTKLPCIIVGLCAQSEYNMEPEQFADNLDKRILRFVEIASHYCKQIGVRGQFTAEVLKKCGAKNVSVTGCPGHYINPQKDLGLVIEKKLRNKIYKLAVGGSSNKDLLKTAVKLFRFAKAYNGSYICQDDEFGIGRGLARNRIEDMPEGRIERVHKMLMPLSAEEKFVLFSKKCFKIFFHVPSWLEYASTLDLFLGTRIHGTIVATQAKTPGICIAWDSRTRELCDTLALPSITREQFHTFKVPEEIIANVNFNGSDFDKKRISLANKYRNLYINEDITVSKELDNLAENTLTPEKTGSTSVVGK